MTMRSIAFFLACGLWLVGCGSAKKAAEEEHEPVVPVVVEAARRDSIRRIVSADGILYPSDQASIVPKISAPVKSFAVKRGDFVKAGQVVAILENQDLAASVAENKGLVAQSEAQYKTLTGATLEEEQNKSQQDVTSAKQALDASRKLYESRQQLFEQGALARRLVDEANVAFVQAKSQYEVAAKHLSALQSVSRQSQIRNAEAQVDSAKARLTGADAQLSYSEVRTPISGVVTDRSMYAGEMAAAGAPLMTVMNVSRVIARVNVPVSQAALLHVGMAATVRQTDTGIESQGRVTVVTAAVDANSTTVQVWVDAANPGGLLKPGSTVRAAIVVGTNPHALVVPKAAVLPAQDGAGISMMVVGADNVAHAKTVELGAQDGEKVEVTKGLAEGDQVVVEGGVGLENGRKVKLRKPGDKDEDEKPSPAAPEKKA